MLHVYMYTCEQLYTRDFFLCAPLARPMPDRPARPRGAGGARGARGRAAARLQLLQLSYVQKIFADTFEKRMFVLTKFYSDKQFMRVIPEVSWRGVRVARSVVPCPAERTRALVIMLTGPWRHAHWTMAN